jgi:hypothetical protein
MEFDGKSLEMLRNWWDKLKHEQILGLPWNGIRKNAQSDFWPFD